MNVLGYPVACFGSISELYMKVLGSLRLGFFIFVTVLSDRENKKRVTVKTWLQFAYVNAVGLSPECNDLPVGRKALHYSQRTSGTGKISKEKSLSFLRKEMDTF